MDIEEARPAVRLLLKKYREECGALWALAVNSEDGETRKNLIRLKHRVEMVGDTIMAFVNEVPDSRQRNDLMEMINDFKAAAGLHIAGGDL